MICPIEIKGIREGLMITLPDGAWETVREELLNHLDGQIDFFKGARLVIDVGNQVIKAAELGRLRDEISGRGLSLFAILCNSPVTEMTAQDLGLATRLGKSKPEYPSTRLETDLQVGEKAIFVHRTLRSGFSLNHVGNVVVVGDVNPGAEIVASGSIVVWGRLRGMVHAGAQGDENVVVCALDLSPTQLRIAGTIALTPQRRGKPQAEVARLINGQVVAETWNPRNSKG